MGDVPLEGKLDVGGVGGMKGEKFSLYCLILHVSLLRGGSRKYLAFFPFQFAHC